MEKSVIGLKIVFIWKETKRSLKSIRRNFRIENVMFADRIIWHEIVLSVLDVKILIMLKKQEEMRSACKNSQQKVGRMLASAELLYTFCVNYELYLWVKLFRYKFSYQFMFGSKIVYVLMGR